MHIVHCLIGRPKPESSNGIVKAVYFLAKNQAALGHTVSIVSMRKKPSSQPVHLFDNVTNYLFEMRKSRFIIDPGIRTFFTEHRSDISIVHFHGGYQAEYWRISRFIHFMGIPFIVAPHGSYQSFANRKSRIRKWFYKQLFEKKVIKNAVGINALNEAEKFEIAAYGVPSKKIVVVPNGIDFSAIPNRGEVEKMESGISGISGHKVAYCGRIDVFSKGLDVLLEAVSLVLKRISDVHLIIVGGDQGGGVHELKTAAEKLGIVNVVHVIGPRFGKEKYAVYAAVDLFALTSRTEGMPVSVLEAMAFGMPCLVTPQTNVDKQAMAEGACAFADLRPAQIADMLGSLLRNSEKLADMGVKAKAYVRNNYDYNSIAEEMCKNYENLILQ